MMKTAVQFATVTEKGVVKQIGRSVVLAPKPNFKGGSIKWAQDIYKSEYKK